MTDDIDALVQRYASRGVLLDSNLLLLLCVGSFRRQEIGRFKRTAQYGACDYDLLVDFLSRFKSVVTTPNVLTEVNGLSNQFTGIHRTG